MVLRTSVGCAICDISYPLVCKLTARLPQVHKNYADEIASKVVRY